MDKKALAASKFQNGVTLVELLLVMGIIAIVFTFTTVNIIPLRDSASLNSTTSLLIADIRQHQLKAMIGDTQGQGTRSPYGIYFSSDGYTVFPGEEYAVSNEQNYTIPLDESVEFQTTLPDNTIIFSEGGGEVINYTDDQNTVTVRVKETGEEKTIVFNKYGTITEVQ